MTSQEKGNAADDFAEFVRSTGAQLYRAALLLTGDHHLAEDLTQTTYAKVFASWRRVSRADNPVAYARTILMNSFLSHRRLRRNSELPIESIPESMTEDESGAAAVTTRIDLLAAVRQLSATDRAVLVARYWEDRSISETAHRLGISETAVRARSHRAIGRLRPHLIDPERSSR